MTLDHLYPCAACGRRYDEHAKNKKCLFGPGKWTPWVLQAAPLTAHRFAQDQCTTLRNRLRDENMTLHISGMRTTGEEKKRIEAEITKLRKESTALRVLQHRIREVCTHDRDEKGIYVLQVPGSITNGCQYCQIKGFP